MHQHVYYHYVNPQTNFSMKKCKSIFHIHEAKCSRTISVHRVALFCVIANLLPSNRGLSFTNPSLLATTTSLSSLRSRNSYSGGSRLLRCLAQISDAIPSNGMIQKDLFFTFYQKHHSGDWAGQLSKFDSSSGALIPVPDHLVPEAMIEWGQIPTQLEVLSSEKLEPSDFTKNEWQLQRTTITVLPLVGCACLETLKSKELISFAVPSSNEPFSDIVHLPRWKSSAIFFSDGAMFVAHQKDERRASHPNRFEICVSVPTEKSSGYEHRVRIYFEADLGNQGGKIIQTPVYIIKERRISETSSDGSFADGDGLDSQTVAHLVGIDTVNKPFSQQNLTNVFSSEIKQQPRMMCDSSKDLLLPGNVMIRYGNYTGGKTNMGGEVLLEVAVSSDNSTSPDEARRCVVVFPSTQR
jgi:hypothetical protein